MGFSLVEALLSIGIFVIIASMILYKYKSYESDVTMQAQVNEVALALREAQVNASSGRQVTPGAADYIPVPYGVFFERTSSPQKLTIFGDVNGDNSFSANESKLDQTIRPGYTMDICVQAIYDKNIAPTCSSSGTITTLKVMFATTTYKVTGLPQFKVSITDVSNGTQLNKYEYAEIKIIKNNGAIDPGIIRIWSMADLKMERLQTEYLPINVIQ
jgi:type II secretory pathway pseudopilin PulG